MTTPETPPSRPRDPNKLWSSGQDFARAALAELSSGADQIRAAGLRSPPPTARARSLVHGFVLPFVIAKRLWRDRPARRQYLKVAIAQTIVTLLFGLWFAYLSDEWRQDVDSPEQLRAKAAIRTEEANRLRTLASADAALLIPFIDEQVAAAKQEEAQAARAEAEEARADAEELAREVAEVEAEISGKDAPVPGKATGDRQPRVVGPPAVAPDSEASAEQRAQEAKRLARARDRAAKAQQRAEEAIARAQKQADEAKAPGNVKITIGRPGEALHFRIGGDEPKEDESTADAPEKLAREVAESEREELYEEETAEDRLAYFRSVLTRTAKAEDLRAGNFESKAQEIERQGGLWIHRGLLFWAALISALYIVQTVIIWLSREYHEAIEAKASRMVGVPPDDAAERPRVRLNLRWVAKKLRRRLRAVFIFGTGLPLIYLVAVFFPDSWRVSTVLSALWFSYWWIVWSAAKTSYAWSEPEKEPWYLRGWTFLTTRVIFFKWFAPRAFGRLWRQFTHSLFAPATCVEVQPWTMAGLGAARAIGSIPVVKLFMRPFFPVAAAILIEERRGRAIAESAGETSLSQQGAEVPPIDAQPVGGDPKAAQ